MQQKLLVGKVSQTERDEIKSLFERKNGLIELIKVINVHEKEDLYEKIVNDMGNTSTKFQRWWDDTSKKYNWETKEEYSWEINFETCEIFLKNGMLS